MRLNWRTTQRSPIGLDVGDRWIKAVQLGEDGRVESAAIVARVQGEDVEAPPLSTTEARRLLGILDRRGFIGRRAVLAVPAQAVMTSILELPPRGSGAPVDQIARSELADAHRRQADDMEAAFWNIPKPARPTEGVPAMAAGCAHEDARKLIDPLSQAGFQIDAMDLQCWAIARVCGRPSVSREASASEPSAEACMIAGVDLGWSSATLMLMHEQTIVYERNLPVAGLKHLAVALRQTHRFGPDVIEYVLRDLGFGGEAPSSEDADLLRKTRSQLDNHFEGLAQELRLSTNYAQHQYPHVPLSRIVLTGGGAGVPGLVDHLASHVDVSAEALTVADALPCAASLEDEAASPALTVAAGLALWDEQEAARCAA